MKVLLLLFVSIISYGQVFDHDDTELRKSFEKRLSKAILVSNRIKDIDRLVSQMKPVDASVFLIMGGPHPVGNPMELHTGVKDFLEEIHDVWGERVFLRKLQNGPFKGDTEAQVCHFLKKSKKRFPHQKIILIGHSYGGSGVVRISKCLSADNVIVDLLVTSDTVPRPADWKKDVFEIPWNVNQNYHFHQRRGVINCKKENRRPDGSYTGIKNFRQFVGKNPFFPHMYVFTNLIRYRVLSSLVDTVLYGPEMEVHFQRSFDRYLSKYPLD